jgi:hypothetical protein
MSQWSQPAKPATSLAASARSLTLLPLRLVSFAARRVMRRWASTDALFFPFVADVLDARALVARVPCYSLNVLDRAK